MAHSNSTTNYNLPQFVSTDKPAWLTDVNSAYVDIDTGMHNAQTAADNAQSDATQALTTAGDASTAAAAADGKATGAVASIAPAFDATATYNVGDKVVYNNLLYSCIVAVVNPGPWSGSANWERAILTNLIPTDSADLSYDGSSTTTKSKIDDNATAIAGVANSLARVVKYTTTSVTFDSTGEGLLTSTANRVVVGMNDLSGGGVFIGYVVSRVTSNGVYIKNFNRAATDMISTITSGTRSVGYYYIDFEQ